MVTLVPTSAAPDVSTTWPRIVPWEFWANDGRAKTHVRRVVRTTKNRSGGNGGNGGLGASSAFSFSCWPYFEDLAHILVQENRELPMAKADARTARMRLRVGENRAIVN